MPTVDPFETLLAHLDADRDRAGERYEVLRRKLLKFFDWRQHADADVLSDRTIVRASRRLAEGVVVASVEAFCLGIARHVHDEYRRGPEARRLPIDGLPLPVDSGGTPETALEQVETDREREREHIRMLRRLRQLPADARRLMTEYYRGGGRERIERRRRLAAERGLTQNALRILVCRLRWAITERARLSGRDARTG